MPAPNTFLPPIVWDGFRPPPRRPRCVGQTKFLSSRGVKGEGENLADADYGTPDDLAAVEAVQAAVKAGADAEVDDAVAKSKHAAAMGLTWVTPNGYIIIATDLFLGRSSEHEACKACLPALNRIPAASLPTYVGWVVAAHLWRRRRTASVVGLCLAKQGPLPLDVALVALA